MALSSKETATLARHCLSRARRSSRRIAERLSGKLAEFIGRDSYRNRILSCSATEWKCSRAGDRQHAVVRRFNPRAYSLPGIDSVGEEIDLHHNAVFSS